MLCSRRSDLEELNKEIAAAQVVRDFVECHLDLVYFFKLSGPTPAWSLFQPIFNILSPSAPERAKIRRGEEEL